MPSAIVVGRGLHAPWNEGTRVIARNIGIALHRAEYDTKILSLSDVATLDVQQEEADTCICHITGHISSRASLAAISDYRYLLQVARVLRMVEAFSGPSVYHLINTPLALAPFVRTRGHRVVAHITLSRQVYSPVAERTRAVIGWRLFGHWVDAFACTSEQIRDDLLRQGYNPRKLHVVPPPIDLGLFHRVDRAQARHALGWDPAAFVVLYIGTVSPLRFPARDVITALHRAAPHIPGLTLKVVAPVSTHSYNVAWTDGNVGPAAADARIPISVVLQDLDEQTKALFYSAADVVLLPFAAPVAVEPPLTLLEAMACQAIVAVAPYANRSRVVVHDVNGVVFTSPDELALRLRALFELSAAERGALGEAARDTIVHRYSAQAAVRAIEQLWTCLGLNVPPSRTPSVTLK